MFVDSYRAQKINHPRVFAILLDQPKKLLDQPQGRLVDGTNVSPMSASTGTISKEFTVAKVLQE